MAMHKKVISLIEVSAAGGNVYSSHRMPRGGLPIIGSVLKDQYDVRIYCEDLTPIPLEKIAEESYLVGFSALTPTVTRSYEQAAELKAMNSSIPIVFGGPHVTAIPEDAFRHEVDYVVRHEGELTMLELLAALETNSSVSKVQGLSYKVNGGIINNHSRPFISNLDTIPFPDFTLIEGYENISNRSIPTSRSCPYECNFCSVKAQFGPQYRVRSIEKVVDEIEKMIETDPAFLMNPYLFFYDDNLLIHRERAMKLFQEIIDRRLQITFTAQASVKALNDAELLAKGQEAGLEIVCTGFETLHEPSLEYWGKKQTPEQMQSGVDTVKKVSDIIVHGMLMIGSPYHTVPVLEEDLDWAMRNLPTAQFMNEIPIPGTALRAERKADGRILTEDWRLYDGHHPLINNDNLPPQEAQAHQINAYSKFYGGSSSNFKKNLWTAGGPLFRNMAREYSRLGHNMVTLFKNDVDFSTISNNWTGLLKPLVLNTLGRHFIARKIIKDWKKSDTTLLHIDQLPFLTSLNESVNSELKNLFESLPDLKKEFNDNKEKLALFYQTNVQNLVEEIRAKIGPYKGLDHYLEFIAQKEQEIMRLIEQPNPSRL